LAAAPTRAVARANNALIAIIARLPPAGRSARFRIGSGSTTREPRKRYHGEKGRRAGRDDGTPGCSPAGNDYHGYTTTGHRGSPGWGRDPASRGAASPAALHDRDVHAQAELEDDDAEDRQHDHVADYFGQLELFAAEGRDRDQNDQGRQHAGALEQEREADDADGDQRDRLPFRRLDR